MRLSTIIVTTLLFIVAKPAWAEEPVAGFNWDNWAQALNESPCNWFSAEQWQPLLSQQYQMSSSNSRDATSCKFTDSSQKPLLTISIRSLPSASAVNAERDGMLAQIRQYGSGRFEQITTPEQAVSVILRKDKLQLFVFANNNNETAFILLSGHPVRGDSDEQKALRKARLLQVAEAVVSKFQF
jgi:hypothetical protein